MFYVLYKRCVLLDALSIKDAISSTWDFAFSWKDMRHVLSIVRDIVPRSFVNAPFRTRNVTNVTVAERARRVETRYTLKRALS